MPSPSSLWELNMEHATNSEKNEQQHFHSN